MKQKEEQKTFNVININLMWKSMAAQNCLQVSNYNVQQK